MMGFSPEFFIGLFPQLLPGAWVSLQLFLISALVGNVLAICVTIARLSPHRASRGSAETFCAVVRGTPLLVQIYILYYGVGHLLAQMPGIRGSVFWPILREGYWYAVVSLSISVAAYSGEIFTGAVRAVPVGLIEAGRSLGLTRSAVFRLVTLPTAIRICLPTLAGESVALLKSTALASTITVLDLLGTADDIRSQTFRVYEPLLAAALFYAAMAFAITRLFNALERHLSWRFRSGG